jgi:hypothetical protein
MFFVLVNALWAALAEVHMANRSRCSSNEYALTSEVSTSILLQQNLRWLRQNRFAVATSVQAARHAYA